MEKQIIKDEEGAPVSVFLSYRDWLRVKQILKATRLLKRMLTKTR